MKKQMRLLIFSVAIIAMTGCSQFDDKRDAYEHAAGRFVYPDKIRACYGRDGDTQRGFEARCFGDGCELPNCPPM